MTIHCKDQETGGMSADLKEVVRLLQEVMGLLGRQNEARGRLRGDAQPVGGMLSQPTRPSRYAA